MEVYLESNNCDEGLITFSNVLFSESTPPQMFSDVWVRLYASIAFNLYLFNRKNCWHKKFLKIKFFCAQYSSWPFIDNFVFLSRMLLADQRYFLYMVFILNWSVKETKKAAHVISRYDLKGRNENGWMNE